MGESQQARSNDEFAMECADVQLGNRASELRNCAMQFMTQGVTITDPTHPDDPIIYASPGFLRLTGYELEDVLGKNLRMLVGPSTDPLTRAQIRDAVRDGRPLQVVLCNYRKDGTKFWNELSITPLRDAAGNIDKIVALHTDVTQRQHSEDQHRQSHTMELIGQLAGGIAHDFNNLLTVILTYCDLLLRSPGPDMRGVDSLLEISEAGQRAASLTRQLLAFSQNRPLAAEAVNINTIIQHLEAMLRRLIGDDIEISIVLQTDLENVLADPRQVAQVVLELTLQARDAMPRGGKLVIETRNIELCGYETIADHRVVPGDYAVLKVESNGPGMRGDTAPTSRNSLLNSDRIPQSVPASDNLITAAEIVVTGYHGYLQVDSRLGAGTTVTVYLPSAIRVAETIPLPSILGALPCGY